MLSMEFLSVRALSYFLMSFEDLKTEFGAR